MITRRRRTRLFGTCGPQHSSHRPWNAQFIRGISFICKYCCKQSLLRRRCCCRRRRRRPTLSFSLFHPHYNYTILYLHSPDMWWHATINIDDYTAFVSTFVQDHLYVERQQEKQRKQQQQQENTAAIAWEQKKKEKNTTVCACKQGFCRTCNYVDVRSMPIEYVIPLRKYSGMNPIQKTVAKCLRKQESQRVSNKREFSEDIMTGTTSRILCHIHQLKICVLLSIILTCNRLILRGVTVAKCG